MKSYFISILCMGILSQSVLAQDAAAFKAKRDKEIAERTKAVAQILKDCKVYTQASDVNKRGIADEVMKGMDIGIQVCKEDQPSLNLAGFMNDVKKVVKTTDQTAIWDETTKIALEKSVEAILALHMRVVNKAGKITSAEAQAIICGQVSKLCEEKRPEFLIIKKSIQHFLQVQKSKPVKYLDAKTQEVLKNQLNALVDAANNTCLVAHTSYRQLEAKHSCLRFDSAPRPDGMPAKLLPPMSQGECQGRQEARIRENRPLEAMAKEKINLDLQQMMSSDLGSLFGTEAFRAKIGVLTPEFIRKSCMENWKAKEHKVLNHVWHADINSARSDLYKLALDELKGIQKKRLTHHEYLNEGKELEKYLKTNPQTITALLKRSNNPDYAKSICYYIRDINSWDKTREDIDTGLMAVGVVSTLAFGFATGGTGLAVASVLGSVTATKIAIDHRALKMEDLASRQAMATKQRDLDKGIAALGVSDEKKAELKVQGMWAAASLVGDVVGLGFTVHKAVTNLGKIKQSQALFELVEGSSEAVKVAKLHKGSQAFTKAVKSLSPEKVGLLKNLTDDQQIKMAALFAKLDDLQGKALIDKLSKLDKTQFEKFFKMIDDASDSNLTKQALLAAIEDFTKTGKPKRLIPDLTVEEIAKLGPSVPKDLKKVATVFPESFKAIKDVNPDATPEEVQKLLSDIRNRFRGKISDEEVSTVIGHLGRQGAESSPELLARFEKLAKVRQRHADLFLPDGPMNSKNIAEESDFVKLAFIEDLETNGVPLRDAANKILVTADGKSLRKSVSKLLPSQRMELIKKEIQTIVSKIDCSL